MFSNNPRRQLLVFCLAAIVTVGVCILIEAYREFDKALIVQREELSAASRLLAEHARLSIRGADIVLSSIVADLNRDGGTLLAHGDSYSATLVRLLTEVPQLSAAAVLDVQGRVAVWVGELSAGEYDNAFAEIFRAHQEGQHHRLGRTIYGDESGNAAIPISRSFGRGGDFQGLVLGLLDVDYFRRFYGNLRQDSERRIGMYLADGSLLTLYPKPSPQGLDYALVRVAESFDASRSRTFVGRSYVDGTNRIASYHFLDDYPVVVSISREYRDFLGDFYWPWGRRALVFIALSLAIVTGYAAIRRSVNTVERQRKRRQKLRDEQLRVARLSREIICHLPNGRVALLDTQLRYVFADGQAFSDHERLAPALVRGKTIRDVHRPEVADLLESIARAAIAGQESAAEMLSDGILYEVTAVPLRNHDGEVDQVLLLSQDITEYRRIQTELETRNQELRQLSFTDPLLNIRNRRAFDMELEREWARGLRKAQQVAVLMIDVDHFKIFNDHYGHTAGDKCLQKIAATVEEAVFRPGDVVARYGGEEMVVLLPETDSEAALEVANRIHACLESAAIPFLESPIGYTVTLSIGVASMLPLPGESAISLVKAADQALYRAKAAGRSKVMVQRGQAPEKPVDNYA